MRSEDLEAWQVARSLVRDVYTLTRTDETCRDLRLCSQIQATAVSVMSNIAEGFERTGKSEKLHFYNIARSSCGEVRSLTYVVGDVYPELAVRSEIVRSTTLSVGRLISGLILSTQNR